HAAFGGYKKSGVGRETHKMMLDHYQQTKKSGVGRETHKMMLDHYQQTKNLLVSYDINPLGFF
ncbi:hypothetical protein ACIU0Q_26470, partial [Pseudomonas aeruginosa]